MGVEGREAVSTEDDSPEDDTNWIITGQASGNRSLMAERAADSDYIAEVTLSSIGGVALLSLDEPSADEVQLMRELLISNELIALVRKFLLKNPGFASAHPDLVRMRDMLQDFDEAWP